MELTVCDGIATVHCGWPLGAAKVTLSPPAGNGQAGAVDDDVGSTDSFGGSGEGGTVGAGGAPGPGLKSHAASPPPAITAAPAAIATATVAPVSSVVVTVVAAVTGVVNPLMLMIVGIYISDATVRSVLHTSMELDTHP